MTNKYAKPDTVQQHTQDDPSNRPNKWEENGFTVIRTHARTAPGCHANCGVLVYVKDGKVDHVEGDPLNPFNEGRLCLRCLAVTETLYNKDRVIYPMMRAKEERGQNTWKRCTWDEAYAYIKEKFMNIIETYGAQSIYVAQGTGRDINGYTPITAHWFGTPNSGMGFLSGLACYAPRFFSTSLKIGGFFIADYGQFWADREQHPGFEDPGCILVWGNNPLVANSDGSLGYWTLESFKRGSKMIVIDPKLTWLAGKADCFLQVRPGTDAALALCLCNYLIQNDLYDHEFVDLWCYGFNEFADYIKDYTVEATAEVCGLNPEYIIRAANIIAEARTTVLQWGVAMDHNPNGLITGMAQFDLIALTGSFEKPGGMVWARQCFGVGETWMPGRSFFEDVPDVPWKADRKLAMNDKYKAVSAMGNASTDMVLESLETGEPYPMKGFWFQTNNPISCMTGEPQRLYPGLLTTDINVFVDLYMTPSAMAVGDVFLPACTWLERDGLTGHQPYAMGAIQKCVEPLGESKSDVQIICEVGKLMAGEETCWFEDDVDFYNYILRKTGFEWQDFVDRTWAYPDFDYNRHATGGLRRDGSLGFATKTGRYQFYVPAMPYFGLDPLAHFEEPPESPVSSPELFKEYPLILVTGARRWGLFHSEHRQNPSMRMIHPKPYITLNPKDAEKYGIKEGDKVHVENKFGDCYLWAELTPRLKEGVVSADHAWWFPERGVEDGTFFGMLESNINCLLPQRPGAGGLGNSYKTQLCRISKVEE